MQKNPIIVTKSEDKGRPESDLGPFMYFSGGIRLVLTEGLVQEHYF